MQSINHSVGKGGDNYRADVKRVQELINICMKSRYRRTWKEIDTDGLYGTKQTYPAIVSVQRELVRLKKPDGLIEPKGRTIQVLNTLAHSREPSYALPLYINYRKNARRVLSEYSKDILKIAMRFAELQSIDISSTRRLIADQIRIMYDQLSKAKSRNIPVRLVRGYGYGLVGREVDQVFYNYSSSLTEAQLKQKMEHVVRTWLVKGRRVSKHVVTPAMYMKLNVLDVPYSSVPLSKRDDFELALVSLSSEVKSRRYSKNLKKVQSLGNDLIQLVIVEKDCWHIEIPQVINWLPDVIGDPYANYC